MKIGAHLTTHYFIRSVYFVEVPWGGRGREVWMLDRGGGQTTSFDNPLNREHLTRTFDRAG